MVSNKLIKSYDFQDINEYFEYIIDSRTNGNKSQAKELYKKLSSKQKKDFMEWFNTFMYYDCIDNEQTTMEAYMEFIQYVN